MDNSEENFINKIFRSATFEGMADNAGFPKDEYIRFNQELAENGV